jgi:hypothetical protein
MTEVRNVLVTGNGVNLVKDEPAVLLTVRGDSWASSAGTIVRIVSSQEWQKR